YRKAPDAPREDAFRDLFEDPQVPVPARVPAVKPDTAPKERQPLLHVPLDAFNDPLAAPRNDPKSSTSRYSTGDSTSSFSTSQGSTMGTGTVPLYTTMPPPQPAPPPYGQGPQNLAPQPYR
ncbi:MAG TPA: hypothetical protein VF632_23405, partial [Longimicrobium sp.]